MVRRAKGAVEICGKLAPSFSDAQGREGAIRACSACSGDYEDPDRTAPAAQEEETERLEPRRQDISRSGERRELTADPDPAGVTGFE